MKTYIHTSIGKVKTFTDPLPTDPDAEVRVDQDDTKAPYGVRTHHVRRGDLMEAYK